MARDPLDELDLVRYGILRRKDVPERRQAALLRSGEARVAGVGLLALPREGLDAWWQELALLVARSWPDVAVSKAAAAALYGLDSFKVGKVPPTVDVLRNSAKRGGGVHRPMVRHDAYVVDGIPFPVVSPADALLGIAGQSLNDQPWLTRRDRVELGFESALHKQLITYDQLVDAIDAAPRTHAGKTILRELLVLRPAALPPTESFLETRTVQVLRRYGITDLQRQVRIYDRNGLIGRVDFVYVGAVLESDSEEHHNTPEAFQKDRLRRSRLLAIGKPVIEITSRRLEFDADNLVADIRNAVRFVEAAKASGWQQPEVGLNRRHTSPKSARKG